MVQAMSGGQGQTIMQVPVSGAQGLQQVRINTWITIMLIKELLWNFLNSYLDAKFGLILKVLTFKL